MQRLLSTRNGTIAVGAFAAVLAAAILLIFLNNYRESVDRSSTPVTVLVAKQLIEKGTPGDLIGSQEWFQTTTVPEENVKDGAVEDPSALRGRVALQDVYPGQQLTASDFAAKPEDDLTYKLSGDERAVAVPLDGAHGLVGYVEPGDHVDVMAGFQVLRINANGVPLDSGGQARPVLKTIIQDVPVLDAPEAGSSAGIGSSQAKNIVLKLTDKQAANLAFASDNGKVWVVLRPQAGATQTPPSVVTIETVLLGVKPVTVLRSFGGRQ